MDAIRLMSPYHLPRAGAAGGAVEATPSGTWANAILQTLADGPARTPEVAAEIGRSIYHTCALLTDLVKRGKVVKQAWSTGTARKRNLWMLPGHVVSRR